MGRALYWASVGVFAMPYLLGYALHCHFSHHAPFHIPLYVAAVSWLLLFVPINMTLVGWLVVTILNVVVTNGIIVITAELIMDPSHQVDLFAKMLVSANTWFAVFATLAYGIYMLAGFDEQSSDTSGSGGQLASQPAWLGASAVDFVGDEFMAGLTLFVGVAEVALVAAAFLVRRVFVRKQYNPRYSNTSIAALCLLAVTYNVSLRALPSFYNVAMHRMGVWLAFFSAVVFRKDEVKVYYAPLRSLHPTLARCSSLPWTPDTCRVEHLNMVD